MNRNDQIDKALCEINAEVLEIRKSREYQLGMKMAKLLYALRHFQLQSILIAAEHKKIVKKLESGHKQNENFITYDASISTDSRIAVYTCITGNYDRPIEPIYVPENVDFYIVTDMEIDPASAWKKIDINAIEQIKDFDNTRKARYVKTHPHVFFENYEYSIWVDSNFKVIGDLSKYIRYVGKVVPFASNWHPARNCIYKEVDACILRKKDNAKLLREQVDYYRSQGFPKEFGLIETNMIIRKHADTKCVALMEAWWNEMVRWSKRDQLSLPYVIWKQGYTMRDLGFTCTEIRDNPSVQVVLHSSTYVAKK